MLKDEERVWQVLNALDTLLEAAEYLKEELKKGNEDSLISIGNDMLDMLDVIYPATAEFVKEMNDENKQMEDMPVVIKLSSDSICLSVKDSLERLKKKPKKAVHKLEFEFIPLVRYLFNNLYVYGLVYPDKDRMREYNLHERERLETNIYRDAALKIGTFKYDISIIVWAYNNLPYTKMCVESILRYPPTEASYELILINHGSGDGTKEYFEQIKPTKQLDIKINGGGLGAYPFITEGEFILLVSNDVVITEHAIDNMFRCIRSDEKIVRIVPTTTNVSNFQTIPLSFKTMDEMFDVASKNNRYDPYRHEHRARLCDPISLLAMDRLPKDEEEPLYVKATVFPDDMTSLRIRRRGYKNVLQKDAFCFHFGSVTIKDETSQFDEKVKKKEDEFYTAGRAMFKEECGIDPWGVGFCYDPQLMEFLPFQQENQVNVLGVNCGMGSNPLKIKEDFKEKRHNLDVIVYNVTDNLDYQEDLRGVSDEMKTIKSQNQLVKVFQGVTFQYILWEDPFDPFRFHTNFKVIIEILRKRLASEGLLCWHVPNKIERQQMKNIYKSALEVGNWILLKKQ